MIEPPPVIDQPRARSTNASNATVVNTSVVTSSTATTSTAASTTKQLTGNNNNNNNNNNNVRSKPPQMMLETLDFNAHADEPPHVDNDATQVRCDSFASLLLRKRLANRRQASMTTMTISTALLSVSFDFCCCL